MASGRLAIVLKVGDQQTAKGKEHLGLKEGMIVTCIDEEDYNDTLENVISEHMRKVFAVVEVPRTLKPKVIDFMASVGIDEKTNNIPDIKKFRPRARVLPLTALEEKTGIPNLVKDLKSAKPVCIIDGSILKASDFKDALKAVGTQPSIPDKNAVTSGNYTVGSGGNYSNWVAAISDTGNLTNDLTFTQISNVTDTSIGYITSHLNGHTLKYTNSSPPAGDPTQGYTVNWNTNVFLFDIYPEGSGTLIIEKLYWKHAQNSIGYNPCIWSGSPSAGFTCHVRNCMFNGQAYTGGWLSMRDSKITWYVYNNVIWKGGNDDGINVTDANSSTVIENNTVYKFGGDGIDCGGKNVTCRDNACFDNTGSAFNNMGSATFTKCASSDNTGSEASLRNLPTASQFVSTSDSNSEFLDIDPSGALDGAGSTTLLPYNTADIHGRPRPNSQNKVSIGGAEVVAAPPSANLFYNGGDTAGADRTLGNKDAFSLGFKTADQVRLSIAATGDVEASGAIKAHSFVGPSANPAVVQASDNQDLTLRTVNTGEIKIESASDVKISIPHSEFEINNGGATPTPFMQIVGGTGPTAGNVLVGLGDGDDVTAKLSVMDGTVAFGALHPDLSNRFQIQNNLRNGIGTITSATTLITGTGTNFLSQLKVGDELVVDIPTIGREGRRITRISPTTQELTIDSAFGAVLNSSMFQYSSPVLTADSNATLEVVGDIRADSWNINGMGSSANPPWLRSNGVVSLLNPEDKVEIDVKPTHADDARMQINIDGASAYGVALKIDQVQRGNGDGPKIQFRKTFQQSPDDIQDWTIGIINEVQGDRQFGIFEGGSTAGFGTARLLVTPGGNIGIGTTKFGLNAQKVITIEVGTAPTDYPSRSDPMGDISGCQIWNHNINADNHVYWPVFMPVDPDKTKKKYVFIGISGTASADGSGGGSIVMDGQYSKTNHGWLSINDDQGNEVYIPYWTDKS